MTNVNYVTKIIQIFLIFSIISTNFVFPVQAQDGIYTEAIGYLNTIYKYLEYVAEFILQNFPDENTSNSRSEPTSVSYKGYQLFRIWPKDEEIAQELKSVEEDQTIQIWSTLAKNFSTDILIPPDKVSEFKDDLNSKDIPYTVLINNLQKIINNHNPKYLTDQEKNSMKETRGHVITWSRYHPLQDIYDYLDYLQDTYSNFVEILYIGKSSYGRDLKLVKISTGESDDRNIKKPSIWIDGGMHAREWISTAVALFIVRQLVEHYTNHKHLVEEMDWYILPVVNPDGYEYTHTIDRLWKKSRSSTPNGIDGYLRYLWTDSSSCEGVDLDKNWDYRWKEATESNNNPCQETYAGTKAFSEPETASISKFILDHRDSLLIYVTLHSYAQMWLMPSSSDTKKDGNDYDDLLYMGRKAIESLRKIHGTLYEIGTKHSSMYNNAGSSADWAKGKAGIKYSYTVKLRDKGTFGYLLPATQIVPTGREIFTAVKMLVRSVISARFSKK